MYKVKKKETFIPSSNGKDKLHVIVWEPQGEIRAILQISHGMIELIDRYDEFARYLAAKGFVVAGNDHLGHGLTAANMDELGYMNAYDASKAIVADLHRVTRSLKKAYKGVPFFLMGHSMGSFMARRYMSDYGWDPKYPSPYTEGSSVDGFICMGTGSMPEYMLQIGRLVLELEKSQHGERYRSTLMELLAFGTYNRGIPKTTIVNVFDLRSGNIILYSEIIHSKIIEILDIRIEYNLRCRICRSLYQFLYKWYMSVINMRIRYDMNKFPRFKSCHLRYHINKSGILYHIPVICGEDIL